MPVIERDGKASLILHAPSDRALNSLWELAQLEVEARDGQAAVTQADWAAVTARYHALVTERRAELGHVIRETRAHEAAPPRSPMQLRAWLTPFGEQLAALLPREEEGLRVRVVSPADALEPLRHLMPPPGPRDVTPDAMIRQWTMSESAILLYEDAAGQPIRLRFFARIAADTVRTLYRVGGGPGAGVGVLRAAWDVGIRRIVAEFHVSRAPERWKRSGGLTGLSERVVTPRGDGWFDQVETLLRRP